MQHGGDNDRPGAPLAFSLSSCMVERECQRDGGDVALLASTHLQATIDGHHSLARVSGSFISSCCNIAHCSSRLACTCRVGPFLGHFWRFGQRLRSRLGKARHVTLPRCWRVHTQHRLALLTNGRHRQHIKPGVVIGPKGDGRESMCARPLKSRASW